MDWLEKIFGESPASPEAVAEARRMEGLVREALAESDTDDGFEAGFRRLLHAPSAWAAEDAWVTFERHLNEFRLVSEDGAVWRVLARRYLDDLTQTYGLEEGPAAQGFSPGDAAGLARSLGTLRA